MTSGVHPKKEAREAIAYAKGYGWTLKVGGSHRWGIIWCPSGEHHFTISSTPRNAGDHAKDIRRAADRDGCKPEVI
jgi:hypothetical protein